MTKLKSLLSFLENISLSIWGLTILDIIPLIDFNIFSSIDNTIKTSMALFGAIYFAISLPFKVFDLLHKKKLQKLDMEIKKEELEKIQNENDSFKNKLKTDNNE